MRQKIILIFSAYFAILIIGLIACDEINDCGPFPNKFKVVGLDWVNYKAIYSDTADTKLLLSYIDNDSVIFNEYSIFIAPRQETYFAQNSVDWNFSLIQSAYACSPVIPTTDEKIDSVVILSQKDFDTNHPAGTDLSDLFEIVVLDNANGIYYEKFEIENYLSTNPTVPSELTLILNHQPDMTTDFEFSIKYYQKGIEDNDFFEFTTNKIIIKRDE
ncbi:MAG: hypothetical protein PHI52_04890 [Bacteroidales bacterium]|nr:hypothetical protein [Bacteroidales bacterium]